MGAHRKNLPRRAGKRKVPVGVPLDKSKSNLREPKTYDEIEAEEAAKQAEKDAKKKKKKN